MFPSSILKDQIKVNGGSDVLLPAVQVSPPSLDEALFSLHREPHSRAGTGLAPAHPSSACPAAASHCGPQGCHTSQVQTPGGKKMGKGRLGAGGCGKHHICVREWGLMSETLPLAT